MRDFRDAKAMAATLREALADKGLTLSVGESLELVSKMLGQPDWNTLSALIKDSRPPAAPQAPAEETHTTADDRARLLARQQTARQAVVIEPRRLDRLVGHYERRPTSVITLARDGQTLTSRFLGRDASSVFHPESERRFFSADQPAQLSFHADARGAITGLVLHSNGRELEFRRITEAAFRRRADELAGRIAANSPSPGAEAALRRHMESRVAGAPDFDLMVPGLAAVARQQWPTTQPVQAALGALKSVQFVKVAAGGADEFLVRFEHGDWTWWINPLGPDGKTDGLGGRPVETPGV